MAKKHEIDSFACGGPAEMSLFPKCIPGKYNKMHKRFDPDTYVLRPRKGVLLMNFRFIRKSTYDALRVAFPCHSAIYFEDDLLVVETPDKKGKYKFRTFDEKGD